MPSYSRIAALRQAIGQAALKPPPFVDRHPFHSDDWRHQQKIREATDSLAYPTRWKITITPTSDRVPRIFYLRGAIAEVTARANALFPSHLSTCIAIEPALMQSAGESISTRLNIPGDFQ